MAGGTTTSARRCGGRAFGPLEYPRRAPRRRRGPLREDRGPSISSPFGISTSRPAAPPRSASRRQRAVDFVPLRNIHVAPRGGAATRPPQELLGRRLRLGELRVRGRRAARRVHQVDAQPESAQARPRRRPGRRRHLHDALGGRRRRRRRLCVKSTPAASTRPARTGRRAHVRHWFVVRAQILQGREAWVKSTTGCIVAVNRGLRRVLRVPQKIRVVAAASMRPSPQR